MKSYGLFAILAIALSLPSVGAAQDVFIAGVNPAERPAGAPVQAALEHTEEWRAQALHGVEQPYPDSLRFLDDQGRWFNPFTRPGMTGPYDIRHWH